MRGQIAPKLGAETPIIYAQLIKELLSSTRPIITQPNQQLTITSQNNTTIDQINTTIQ